MNSQAFGRILSADIRECFAACRVSEEELPAFGSLVRIPIRENPRLEVYGLVSDIRIEEDGFLRQIASNENVSEEVMQDARINRNVPIVMRILFVGSISDAGISNMVPPHPPLTLNAIYRCAEEEIAAFTTFGEYGYLRHILDARDISVSELLAAHVAHALSANSSCNNPDWGKKLLAELILQKRSQTDELLRILNALKSLDFNCEAEVI